MPTQLSLETADGFLRSILVDGILTTDYSSAQRRLANLLDNIAIEVLEGAAEAFTEVKDENLPRGNNPE